MNIQRKENENKLDYMKRLVYGKLVDNELKLVSHADISELIFDKRYSEDVARRMVYGVKRTFDTIEEEQIDGIEDDSLLKQIEEKTREFEKEKIKMQDQKREYRTLLRECARFEQIKDTIRETVNEIELKKPLLKVDKYGTTTSNNEGVVILSDWHAGLACNNYWNEFNTEILRDRISKFTNKSIEYGKSHKINKLHVFGLGDLINGGIHVTTRISNSEDVVKQTQLVAELLSEILVEFSNNFEEIIFYNAIGNHDRVTPNKKESLYNESFSLFIPWYMEVRLRAFDNIKIVSNDIDNGIIKTYICDNTIFGVHGDLDKIKTVVKDLTLMLKEFPDYIFMGHTHHHEELEVQSVEVIVNSTLSGVDEFAKTLRVTSKPSQKFMVFNEEGRECTYNIQL